MALAFDATLGTVTNTATLTTSAAAAADSRVFVFLWWYDTTATCTGMSAGGGLTWVVDNQMGPVAADGGTHLAVLSADAPAGLASSTNLTPSFSTGVAFGPGIAAHSWTGVKQGASGYVNDLSFNQSNFNETWATDDVVTTVNDTLLFGISVGPAAGQTNFAATDYTERHDWFAEGENRVAVVSRAVTSTGTYNPGGAYTQTVDFQANFGIAYEAGEPAPPPEVPTLMMTRAATVVR